MSASAKYTPKQIDLAFAACRSIRFAVDNAGRYGGEFSLNDILAADRLAKDALQGTSRTPARTRKGGGK